MSDHANVSGVQESPRSHTHKAPKARPIPARGEAPCLVTVENRGLKARLISIPQMLIVGVQSILPQERTQLITKRMLAMMRYLSVDVSQQRIKIGRPNGERPITDLPGEIRNSLCLQPSRRGGLQLFHQLRDGLFLAHSNRKMHMIGNAPGTIAFASSFSCDRREVRKQIGTNVVVEQRQSLFGAEDHMNHYERKRSWHSENYRSGLPPSKRMTPRSRGFAPRWYSVAPLALVIVAVSLMSGCKPAPKPIREHWGTADTKSTYPPRPTIAPPAFHVFQITDNSITLVTSDNATDDQIAAILWQLHDAAHNHTFDQLHIGQKSVDKRDPIIWFHIYRGPRCADEKYTTGKLPCGPSYHAAGDFTYGGFTNRDHTEGALLHNSNAKGDGPATALWNAD